MYFEKKYLVIIIPVVIFIFFMAFLYFDGINLFQKKFICGQLVKYENKNYETILINNKCWFQRNLNVGKRVDSKKPEQIISNNKRAEKYCYNDLEINCTRFGGLYRFEEAMQGSKNEISQGICPKGFHIATDAEFHDLENYFKGGKNSSCKEDRIEKKDCGFADSKLKRGGGSGFEAVLGGYHNGQKFSGLNYNMFFLNSSKGIFRSMDSSSGGVFRSIDETGKYSLSVRCVRN